MQNLLLKKTRQEKKKIVAYFSKKERKKAEEERSEEAKSRWKCFFKPKSKSNFEHKSDTDEEYFSCQENNEESARSKKRKSRIYKCMGRAAPKSQKATGELEEIKNLEREEENQETEPLPMPKTKKEIETKPIDQELRDDCAKVMIEHGIEYKAKAQPDGQLKMQQKMSKTAN